MVFHFETKHDGSKEDSLAQLKGEEEILLFSEREKERARRPIGGHERRGKRGQCE